MIERSWVRSLATPLSGNNSGQVVHIHVPLSPSSITWCRCKSRGGNGRLWKRCGLPSITGCKPTAGSRPVKQRWAIEHRSLLLYSPAILTGGNLPFLPFWLYHYYAMNKRGFASETGETNLWRVSLVITHTTHNRFTALWNLSGKTRVSRYQKNIHPLLSS